MQITYGQRTAGIPDGFYKRIHFPSLMQLDYWTPDGRRVESAGFMPPNLPEAIKFLDFDSEGGHLGSHSVGRLDEVTVHEDGNVSGWGLLADDEKGRHAATAVKLKTVYKNSVDLRDVDVAVKFPDFEEMFKEDEDGFVSFPKIQVTFRKSRIGATTLVMQPGMPNAYAEIAEDELTASWDVWSADVAETREEMLAGMTLTTPAVPWADFHIPEHDHVSGLPLTVDEDGRVFGHLGLYGSCHTGFLDRCVMIPQSRTGYASFCSASVLTDNGLVRTGPLFLFGGHPQNAKPETINSAYGGIENAWADVRVINGKHGPWMSGRVRPGVPDELVHAARGSKVSGHWFNGELFAVVSVNAPGFDVPYQYAQDGADELLTASFATAECGCGGLDPLLELELMALADDDD